MLNVLIFDIETAPILAYVWGLHDQNVGLNQIYRDSYVIAWAAKWLGQPASSVIYRDLRNAKNKFDDQPLLKEMWRLLNKADVVITQNGRNFDSKRLNARFIIHGMRPPRPYQHWDTLQVSRRVAKFTSHKLEYMTDKVNTKYKKLKHKKFPGFELWQECLKETRRHGRR
jgi:DNA polymerase elongation subunit (family B)